MLGATIQKGRNRCNDQGAAPSGSTGGQARQICYYQRSTVHEWRTLGNSTELYGEVWSEFTGLNA